MASGVYPQSGDLIEIGRLDSMLYDHFKEKFFVDANLDRQLVSFQANKIRPCFRWYKYKEAFSAGLVEYLLTEYNILSGRLLDPLPEAARLCSLQVRWSRCGWYRTPPQRRRSSMQESISSSGSQMKTLPEFVIGSSRSHGRRH